MTVGAWIIEPRDPVVFRDGRPNRGRSESRTVPFPSPSVAAGLVRTRLGSDPDRGFVAHRELDELRRVTIRGPLLWDVGAKHLLVAAPLDAVLLGEKADNVTLHALSPFDLPAGCAVDPGLGDLSLLGLPELARGKPLREVPTFWDWSCAEAWLAGEYQRGKRPAQGPMSDLVTGLGALPTEHRTHVALGPTATAIDGKLFATEGLCFELGCSGGRRFGLRVDVSDEGERTLSPGLAAAGGERRLVRWAPLESSLPMVPDWLVSAASSPDRVRVRVLLLTPALFVGGALPGSESPLLRPRSGLELELIAARVPPPAVVSGWDLAKGRPKPTRRVVPAGSVYWIELRGEPAKKQRWLEEVWMQNVSCDEQDRRDGWGLAAVGVA